MNREKPLRNARTSARTRTTYSPEEGLALSENCIGQDFDAFLKEEGMLDSITAAATKRVIVATSRQAKKAKKLIK